MTQKFSSGGTKAAALIVAAVIIAASAIVGTYAWKDHRQHKTNEISGAEENTYNVTLVEDFQPNDDWNVEHPVVKKEVRVTNPESAFFDKGAVFVRLIFKEYMETATQTDLANPNPVAIPLIPGTSNAGGDAGTAHNAASNGECAYPAYNLANPAGGRTAPIHEYVKWNHGQSVLPLSAWKGGQSVWVYNDLDPDDTYVYWIAALSPGDTTANALDSVELIKQPDGAFYYAVHVDLEAVSKNELSEWRDIPAEIYEALKAA
jgi:alternate signal-mediated exported protein